VLATPRAKSLELAVDVEVGLPSQIRRIWHLMETIRPVAHDAVLRRFRRIGTKRNLDPMSRIPGGQIGDLLIRQTACDDAHHLVLAPPVAEGAELIFQVSRGLAADVGRGRELSQALHAMAGSTLASQRLSGLPVPGRPF